MHYILQMKCFKDILYIVLEVNKLHSLCVTEYYYLTSNSFYLNSVLHVFNRYLPLLEMVLH